MTPKLYEYYLLNDSNEYYYMNGSNLETTVTETPLRTSPKEWDTQSVKFGRNVEGYGINQSVSGVLTFYGDARAILQRLFFYDDGIRYDAYCRIIIKKRNDTGTNVWSYDTWFDGLVDFTAFKDRIIDGENIYCQVRCYENNLMQTYEANKSKPYEISLANKKTINIEGADLDGLYEWVCGNIANVTVSPGDSYPYPLALLERDTKDYFAYLINPQTQVYDPNNGSAPTNALINTSLAFTGELTLSLDFNWVNNSGGSGAISLYLTERNRATGASTQIHTFWSSGTIVGSGTNNESITGTYTATFQPDLYDYFINIGQNLNNTYTYEIVSSEVSISFTESLPNTDCKAMKYFEYGQELVSRVFNGQVVFKSDFLTKTQFTAKEMAYKYYNLLPSNVMVTSGDAIRQQASPSIKGSLLDYVNDCYIEHGCGWAIIGNKFVIEPLSYFMNRNSLIFTINGATVKEPRAANDLLYNKLKVGNAAFRANDLNGRYEWNSQQEWEITGVSANTDEKDLVSSYRTAMYEIEELRSLYFSSETKDNDNDNGIYKIDCLPTTTNNKYTVRKYPLTNGLLNPDTVYNIAFSPHRKLQRHIPEHKSVMNIKDNEYNTNKAITFVSADRNVAFSTYIVGVYNNEAGTTYPANVPLAHAQGKLFVPCYMDFEFTPQEGLLQAIKANPYGYIAMISEGKTYNVYIWDVEITGSEKDTVKLTGLLTPFNISNNFISG